MPRNRRVPFAIWVTLWAIIVLAALALIAPATEAHVVHRYFDDRPASACALGLNRLANIHSRGRLESGTSDRPSPEINHVARNHPPYRLNFASPRSASHLAL